MTLDDKIWSLAFVLAAILALVVYASFVEPWLRRDQARMAHAYAERVSCAIVAEMSHPHQPMPGHDPEEVRHG